MALNPAVWLDKVRAVPAVGIHSAPSFESSAHILSKVKSVLARWHSAHESVKVKIEDGLRVRVERGDGLVALISHDDVVCQFRYITNITEMGSLLDTKVDVKRAPTPYSELLSLVQEALRELTVEIYKDGNRRIERIGVVSEAAINRASLPPGLDSFLSYLAGPWEPLGIEEVNCNIVATLNRTDEYRERCHHFVTKAADETSVVKLRLDWQRFYDQPIGPNANKLADEVGKAASLAVGYFGKFGIGDLIYGCDATDR